MQDFNPRPREEGDQYNDGTVSTYTTISIHALVKRATLFSGFPLCSYSYFNPRPREEGDRNMIIIRIQSELISIHALVKRATFV